MRCRLNLSGSDEHQYQMYSFFFDADNRLEAMRRELAGEEELRKKKMRTGSQPQLLKILPQPLLTSPYQGPREDHEYVMRLTKE